MNLSTQQRAAATRESSSPQFSLSCLHADLLLDYNRYAIKKKDELERVAKSNR
jgi:ribosomal protein S7